MEISQIGLPFPLHQLPFSHIRLPGGDELLRATNIMYKIFCGSKLDILLITVLNLIILLVRMIVIYIDYFDLRTRLT